MRNTMRVTAGGVAIGGGAPITIQSMTNTDTADVNATVEQILHLERAGCEIVRSSVYNEDCVKAIPQIRERIHIPLVADIHFDYRLAIGAIEQGVDKLRFNPGNIGGEDRVRLLTGCAKAHGVPVRIGVNSGSVERPLLKKYGRPSPQAMVESAMRHVRLLENENFYDIVISLKASNVTDTVEAYRIISETTDYPLHVGITEAGTWKMSLVKSSAGIGSLLLHGIGDTVRVSMTDDPVKEVAAGYDILKAIGLKKDCPEIVSCPTCGRTKIDLISLANAVEQRLVNCRKPIKVAVMGCAVNGPGEAKEADIGIAGGDGCALIFKKGQIIRKVAEAEVLDCLIEEIEKI